LPHIAVLASIFPYDPNIDSALAHRHLVIAYSLVWFVQLGYLLYVGKKWFSARASAQNR
jgi:hypothetical protein